MTNPANITNVPDLSDVEDSTVTSGGEGSSTSAEVTGAPEDAQFTDVNTTEDSAGDRYSTDGHSTAVPQAGTGEYEAPTSDPYYAPVDADGDGRIDVVHVDLDHDGIDDQVVSDTDGDGIPDRFATSTLDNGVFDDVEVDTNADGTPDQKYTDTDGDGYVDTAEIDTDFSGVADEKDIDTDGDGRIDTVLTDTDNDGVYDYLGHDTDGDGIADVHAINTPDGWTSAPDDRMPEFDSHDL